MEDTGIKVCKDADSEGTKGIGDLGVGGEANGREVVDDVADEADDDHHRHLLPFALVDDDQAQRKGRDENEGEPGWRFCSARHFGDSVRIDTAVKGRPDGDAETEEKGINDCVDHADGARDDIFGLEFQRAAEDGVTWKDKGDGRLRQCRETEEATIVDGAESTS